MVVSSLTISDYSCYSNREIENLVINSYEYQNDDWKLSEPPRLNIPLGVLVESIPISIRKKLLHISKLEPHLFWTYTGKMFSPREYLLQLKIKFQFECTPIEFDASISKKSRSTDEQIFFQRKFNLFLYLQKILNEKAFNLKEVFAALNTLGITYYKSYSSLNRFYSKRFNPNDTNCIFHACRGKVRSERLRWSNEHVSIIRSLYSEGFDTQQITDKLKEQCEDEGLGVISRSTVKRIIKLKRLDILCAEERLGTAYVKNNLCGYVERRKPDFKMQVIEADGSRLQLPYKVHDNSRWKVRYLTLYVIIDVASTKVLGYSIDDFENKEMALMAFYMMFLTHKRLPPYLKIDRSSAHKSYRFKRFLSEISKKGIGYRFCYEPRDKGVVESFYHWFPEKICKLFKIYTGLSLVVKSWFNQPNPENVSKILNSSKKLPTRQELIQVLPDLVARWNNRHSPSINSTPNSCFATLNYKDAKFMDESFAAYLTWRIKLRNRFSRNTITHHYNGEKLSYRLSNSDNIINIHGKEITIAWLETELNRIYVFGKKGEFIELAKKKKKYLDDPISIDTEEYNEMIEEKNSNYKLIQDIRKKVEALKIGISQPGKELIQLNISSGLQSNKNAIAEIEEEFIDTHYLRNKIDKKIVDEIDQNHNDSIHDKRFSKFKWINNE